ncbi:uncharacterized protein [Physcomitrium patens]|uniref:uncharacterized protein isoform X2 n=1 Tax=Physcomitrium patens TaxID=3218 RepID=UPI000D17D632|nr:uncharacterized protein LOC112294908 isoform X2 [Physcomitrium patens]|eukprot:XP_024401681.1 uncharacterized protein LOC112294908 isoform X2 [Physcomitrella patens]
MSHDVSESLGGNAYPELQAHLEGLKAAAEAAGSCLFHEINDAVTWKKPAFFTCSSGVMLWGQLHSLMQGSVEKNLDSQLGPYTKNKPGDCHSTILQQAFRYRVPARKGLWKVEVAYLGGVASSPPIGFVCHNVDVDGADLLLRAAVVGASLSNDHQDREIVFVNRYDWGRWGCCRGDTLVTEILEPEENSKGLGKKTSSEDKFDDEEYSEYLVANRFMLVDAQGFPHLVQALKDGKKLDRQNYLFSYQKDSTSSSTTPSEESPSDSFGVNLCIDEFDYELGWMAFQNGELVGFVYDGVYCDLDASRLRLKNPWTHLILMIAATSVMAKQ